MRRLALEAVVLARVLGPLARIAVAPARREVDPVVPVV